MTDDRRILILRLLLACLLPCLLALAATLCAQDVQVHSSDAQVSSATIAAVERMTHTALRELRPNFPGTEFRPITVFVHSSTATLGAELRHSLHPGTAGCAILGKDEVHLMIREAISDSEGGLQGVVKHELVHVLLDQHAGKAGPFIPRWFHEGLAQTLAESGYLDSSEEALVFRAATGTLIEFHDLDEDFPRDDEMMLRLAYRQSWSWVSYLEKRVGLMPMLAAARAAGPKFQFHQLLAGEIGHGLIPLKEQWIDWLIHESGAPWRALMRGTFESFMLLAVPLLFVAVIRKRRRDTLARDRLTRADALAESYPVVGNPSGFMEESEQRP